MKLYTAQQTAEMLGLSKQTVWKYGREGKLRTVKFGRTVRYDLEGGRNEVQSNALHEQVYAGRG
jgi:excisionase family DNA binding protein